MSDLIEAMARAIHAAALDMVGRKLTDEPYYNQIDTAALGAE